MFSASCCPETVVPEITGYVFRRSLNSTYSRWNDPSCVGWNAKLPTHSSTSDCGCQQYTHHRW